MITDPARFYHIRDNSEHRPRDGILTLRGLVIVDKNGVDRLRIQAPLPDPLVLGKRFPRGGAVSGILLFDDEGNERSGYVTSDGYPNVFFTLDSLARQHVLFITEPQGDPTLRLWDGANAATLSAGSGGPGLKLTSGEKTLFEAPAPVPVPTGKTRENRLAGPECAAQDVVGKSKIWRGHDAGINAMALSPDGARLATADIQGTLRLWDTGSGGTVRVMRGRDSELYAVAFARGGDLLVTTGNSGVVTVIDARSGKTTRELKGLDGWSVDLAVSPDGRLLASTGFDKTVRVWDLTEGRERYVIKPEGFVHQSSKGAVTEPIRVPLLALAFSPEGKFLATAGADRLIRLWEAGTGRLIAALRGGAMSVTALAFNRDGKTLYSAGLDRTVRVWPASDFCVWGEY